MYESATGQNLPNIVVPQVLPIADIPDDEQAVADIIAGAAKQMAELKALMAPIITLKKEFTKEAEEHAKRMREAERKAKQADSAMFDAKRALRKLEETEANAKRKAARLAALKAFQENIDSLNQEFDEITANAPWRDSALPHQLAGMHFLANAKRALLADAPRFGKTLTVLGTCDMLKAKRVLIFTPNTVTNEFHKQIKRWAPHRSIVINLSGKSKVQRQADMAILNFVQEFVVICNFEAWRRDKGLIEAFKEAKFDTVIIDEAHSMANTKTAVFEGIKDIVYAENALNDAAACVHCGTAVTRNESNKHGYRTYEWLDSSEESACAMNEDELIHHATGCSVVNVFPMTGTFIVNKPQDLWASLYMVDQFAFPSRYQFEREFLKQDWDTGKWDFKVGGLDALTKRLADKYIRRDRTNSPEIKIPTPEIVVRTLTLTQEEYPLQYKVIKDLNKAIVDYAENIKVGINEVITLILRKRQAVTWPHFVLKDNDGTPMAEFKVDESIKIDECINVDGEESGMIPDLVNSGEKVVLASQFVGTLEEIERRAKIAGINVTNLGHLPVNERIVAADAFNALEGGGLMLGHYKVMGTGINLAAANEMIILDEAWNPAGNDQMYDRIVQMGKEDKCQVTILRVANSIDTWMAELNDHKRNVIGGFNSEMDIVKDFMAIVKDGMM